MRVPAALFALMLAVPATAAGPNSLNLTAPQPPHCPKTSRYVAGETGIYRGQPLTPRKLTELPPGRGYMAVYRRVDGCEFPMTMVEYRNGRGR